ncbi:hypothetical protein BSKO_01244 [Bryopsis sp. KO-2023]|nr:hypothetical protein BSKO_01244 [Bryopsis sp. KO-2023]
MPTPAIFGALVGVTLQIYANAVRKVPVWRSPWEHAIWGGLGAAAFSYGAQKKADLEVEVKEMIAKRAELSKGPPRNLSE